MAAFAEVADLVARWRPLVPPENTQAGVLLEDASAIVRAECPTAEATVDAGVLKLVVCAMVKRAMLASGLEGVSSGMDVAGPFTQQRSFSNPMGNLYLTKQERRLLGYGASRAFFVDLTRAPGSPGTEEWV